MNSFIRNFLTIICIWLLAGSCKNEKTVEKNKLTVDQDSTYVTIKNADNQSDSGLELMKPESLGELKL